MKKQDNNKQILILSLFVFSIIFLTTFVSATVTLNAPLKGANNTGTVIINCTGALTDTTNATSAVIYRSAGTGGAATTVLTTITNDTANDIHFYTSVSIASLSGADYNLTCTFVNATGNKANSTGTTDLTFDSTAPTCTSQASMVSNQYMELYGRNTLTCDCTDDVDSSPTITRKLHQGNTGVVTITSSPYTTSGTDVNKVATYTFSCNAVDYATNSGSTNKTFSVDSDDSVSNTIVDTATVTTGNNTNMKLFIIIISAIVAIIVIIGFSSMNLSKKSKKRR